MPTAQFSSIACAFHMFGHPDWVEHAAERVVSGLDQHFRSVGMDASRTEALLASAVSGQGDQWPPEGRWWRWETRWEQPGTEHDATRAGRLLKTILEDVPPGEALAAAVVWNAEDGSAEVVWRVAGTTADRAYVFSPSQLQQWLQGPGEAWELKNNAKTIHRILLEKALALAIDPGALGCVVARQRARVMEQSLPMASPGRSVRL